MYIFPLLLTSRIPVYHSLLFLCHKCNCYVLYPHHIFVPVWGTVGRFYPIWGDLNFVFNWTLLLPPNPCMSFLGFPLWRIPARQYVGHFARLLSKHGAVRERKGVSMPNVLIHYGTVERSISVKDSIERDEWQDRVLFFSSPPPIFWPFLIHFSSFQDVLKAWHSTPPYYALMLHISYTHFYQCFYPTPFGCFPPTSFGLDSHLTLPQSHLLSLYSLFSLGKCI